VHVVTQEGDEVMHVDLQRGSLAFCLLCVTTFVSIALDPHLHYVLMLIAIFAVPITLASIAKNSR
jgi:hypothetical protein